MMTEVEIFFSEDSEWTEFDFTNKGWRGDVWVKIHQDVYRVCAFTLDRLQVDFNLEMEEYEFYVPDHNLFFVKETSKQEIISTINYLAKQKFFCQCKPLDNLDADALVKVQ